MYAYNHCPWLLHYWIQRHRKEMNSSYQTQDKTNSINTSESTAPYATPEKLTSWAIGESNPGPFALTASGRTTGPRKRPSNCPIYGFLMKISVQWSINFDVVHKQFEGYRFASRSTYYSELQICPPIRWIHAAYSCQTSINFAPHLLTSLLESWDGLVKIYGN